MEGKERKKERSYALIAFILLLAFIIYANRTSLSEYYHEFPWLFVVLFVLFLFFMAGLFGKALIELREYERAVILRFGKFNRVGGPGWTLVLPFIESHILVDLRTKTLDVEKQDVITKDSIEVKIDAVIYLRVKKDKESVAKSVLEVQNLEQASRTYIMAALRDVIGAMDCADLISNIEAVNTYLHETLSEITKQWGVEVVAVQIKDLDLPEPILKAMHEQKAAVQEKLARQQRAEAQKIEVETINQAACRLNENVLNYLYIKALEKISDGQSTKIFFPVQFTELAQAISNSIGSKNSNIEPLLKKAIQLNLEKAIKKAKRKGKK
ncbi:MAG: SPFH domain-containing protein [Candidatus Diapherotrites archaeon]|nr:SPFH domain-containing protein [Candidatus Diapherotrites archaeon]